MLESVFFRLFWSSSLQNTQITQRVQVLSDVTTGTLDSISVHCCGKQHAAFLADNANKVIVNLIYVTISRPGVTLLCNFITYIK